MCLYTPNRCTTAFVEPPVHPEEEARKSFADKRLRAARLQAIPQPIGLSPAGPPGLARYSRLGRVKQKLETIKGYVMMSVAQAYETADGTLDINLVWRTFDDLKAYDESDLCEEIKGAFEEKMK